MTKLDKEFMKRVRKLIEKRHLDRRKMFRKLAQGVGFSFKSPVKRTIPLHISAVGESTRTKSIGRTAGRRELEEQKKRTAPSSFLVLGRA